MKKLKTGLILLLALLMSLCLFACGGGHTDHYDNDNDGKCDECGEPVEHEHVDANNDGKCDICGESMGTTPPPSGGDDDEETEYTRISVYPSEITLTDSDDEAKLQAELAKVEVTARTVDGDDEDYTLADCDYTSTAKVHEVGEYTFAVTLKKDESKKTTSLTVVIEHDWGTETDGVKVCKYDQARQETRDENVVVHYGNFHEGTDPVNYATAKAEAGWDEATAYTNNGTNSAIKEFGYVGDKKVPTLTAGQLEPGTTITIRGVAKTTAEGSEGAVTSPWGEANSWQQQWNFPSIGIADRYNTTQTPGYNYGVSVIVRQEGWVLYNGIGQNANNTLGGIMGSSSASTAAWRNYGSHPSELTTTSPDPTGAASYVHGVVPTDWSNIGDWWVYSTGDEMHSGTVYQEADEYEYTWNYREDGVIEMTYKDISAATTLKVYIKVPDSSVGYYDTIIHGDYNDMTITESVITTKRTPKAFRLNGVKSGANSVYAENQAFDATTLSAEMQYEQTNDTWNPVQIVNAQVYAYQGTLSRADLAKAENAEEFASIDPTLWKSLDSNKLSSATTIYKVHLEKGGKVYDALLAADAITVLPNKVASAIGADVTVGADDAAVDFANNGKVGALDFSVDTAAKNVVLTLAGESYVQKLSDAQKAKFEGTVSATRYIALRINAAALGKAFTAEGVKVNNGSVPVIAQLEGDDLCLVLALSEAGKYTVTGAQDTAIVLDLTNLKGFSLESEITGELKLNAGGDLKIVYTVPTGTERGNLNLNVNVNGSNGIFGGAMLLGENNQLNTSVANMYPGFTVKSATLSGTTFTLELTIAAANLSGYRPVVITLSTNGSTADSIVDSIDYNMTVDASKYQLQSPVDGYYGYAERGTFNVLKVFEMEDVKDGAISGEFTLNLNDGDLENFKKYGLITVSYRVANGELVLTNAPAGVTGDVTVIGTYGDSRDTDKGAYVLFTVDLATLGLSGDYYVEFYNGAPFDPSDSGKPTTLNKVSGTTLSKVTLDSTYTMEIVMTAEGTCYEEGLYGWAVSKDNKVISFANAAKSGGGHVDADEDGTCDLCGGTITEAALPAWADPYTGVQFELTEGKVIDVSGKFASSVSDAGGNYGPFISIMEKRGSANARYWLRTDGWVVCHPTDGWAADVDIDEGPGNVDPNGTPVLDENFYTSLPANTLNGVVTNDGVTLSDFASYFAGKTYRFVVSYVGTTIRVDYYYYTPDGALSLNYYIELRNRTGSSYSVHFFSDLATSADGNGTFTVAEKVNSVIDTVASATVDSHNAPTTIEYKLSKGNGYAVIALTGVAGKDTAGYYAAFKVNFSSALAGSTQIKFVDKDGKAIANAKATLSADKMSMDVYLPISTGLTEAYIDFTNYEASMKQADIKLDLADLACSDVTATVSANNVNVGAGTFTIEYNGVEGTDTLTIGDVSKTLTELKTQADFGNGYKVQAGDIASGKVTVTFTKAAADLSKAVYIPNIRLERSGSLLYSTTLENVLTANGTELDQSGWYAVAAGNTLTLMTNSTKEAGSFKLSINAGAKTSKELLVPSDLAFTVVNGAVSFSDSSVLSRIATAVYSAGSDKYLVAIVFDLTKLGVAENVAYGYALEEANAMHIYKVAADRAITDETKATGAKTELQKGDCEKDGFSAYTVGTGEAVTFYYGIDYVKGEHHFPADGGLCTVCEKVTGWKKENVVVGTEGSGTTGWTNSATNGYDPKDTEKFGAIVKGQKAVFEGLLRTATSSISGSWLNMHGPLFKIGGLTMRCDGYVDTLSSGEGDYATNQWHVNTVESVKYDGTAYTGGEIPWGDAVQCRGNASATITYDWTNPKEIVFTLYTDNGEHNFEIIGKITSTAEGGEFASGIYEIGLLPFYCYFNGTLTVTGDKDTVSADKCNQWLRDPGAAIPDPTYTADTEITKAGGMTMGTVGTPGDDTKGWAGYSNTPNWISKFEKGKKIVLTGTQKSAANQPFWSSLTFFVWSSAVSTMPTRANEADPGICMNHFNGAAGHDEAFTISGPAHKLTGGDDFATLIKEVGADCDVSITFDWTQYNKQFTVTMKLTKGEKAVETTYTFTVKDGQSLAAYYNVGVGVDHSYANLTTITRTEKAPTQDLPGAEQVTHEHAYVNGLCTVCGGVQPASDVNGTAVQNVSWENTQAFKADIWTMSLKKGGKVTVYGTQQGDVSSNWLSLLARVLFDNDTAKSITLRSDNFGFYDDNIWETAGPSHALEETRKANGGKSANGDALALDWGNFVGIAKHCDWRVDFDWTGNDIVVTMTFTGTADNQYKGMTIFFAYTLDAAEKTTATIGLGTESAAGTVVCYVASNNE